MTAAVRPAPRGPGRPGATAGSHIYPGSGHGFLFQYPSLVVAHVARFLDIDAAFT